MTSLICPNVECNQYLNPSIDRSSQDSILKRAENNLKMLEFALAGGALTQVLKIYHLIVERKIFELPVVRRNSNLMGRLRHIEDSLIKSNLLDIRPSVIISNAGDSSLRDLKNADNSLTMLEQALTGRHLPHEFSKALKIYDSIIESRIFALDIVRKNPKLMNRMKNIEKFLVKIDLVAIETLQPAFLVHNYDGDEIDRAEYDRKVIFSCLKNNKFALARIVFKYNVRDGHFINSDLKNNNILQGIKASIEKAMLDFSDRFKLDSETHEIILLPKKRGFDSAQRTVVVDRVANTQEINSKDAKGDRRTEVAVASCQSMGSNEKRVDSKDPKEKSMKSESKKEVDSNDKVKTDNRTNVNISAPAWLREYARNYRLMPTEIKQGMDIRGKPKTLYFFR